MLKLSRLLIFWPLVTSLGCHPALKVSDQSLACAGLPSLAGDDDVELSATDRIDAVPCNRLLAPSSYRKDSAAKTSDSTSDELANQGCRAGGHSDYLDFADGGSTLTTRFNDSLLDESNSQDGRLSLFRSGEDELSMKVHPPLDGIDGNEMLAGEQKSDSMSIGRQSWLGPVDEAVSPRYFITRQVDLSAEDYAAFYSPSTMASLAVGLAAAAVFANSDLDQYLTFDLYDENVSPEATKTIHTFKLFGEDRWVVPIFAAITASTPVLDDSVLGGVIAEWGERSWRTFVVGSPVVFVGQFVTGASRPGESASGSRWEPFADNNGISGHAFVGAIPFLTAAQMTDRQGLRLVLTACSTLAALSRVNDRAHYVSQSFLGWYIAYLSSALSKVPMPAMSFRSFPTSGTAAAEPLSSSVSKRFRRTERCNSTRIHYSGAGVPKSRRRWIVAGRSLPIIFVTVHEPGSGLFSAP